MGKRPANISRSAARAAQFGGRDAWLLPLLGALALIFSWLAALGGVSDGTVDLRTIFDNDTLRASAAFRDMFLDDGYSASGWTHGKSPLLFS